LENVQREHKKEAAELYPGKVLIKQENIKQEAVQSGEKV
jgi:hypothetical protein